ncbi:hypothetical protein [Salinisphaera sp. G21_0]|uniref:hypothetical protein n=1 Tax=Salinisphaera sp. G21_0 TaxID=2821094 RepID=UPI001ADBDC1E|nr:hypothetical protein [Salinisphaera sp. G21_0]MBO9481681.1 hypothetical protein [Salinisphaera sp. G21_0]
MNPMTRSSGQLPVHPQTRSRNTESSDDSRVADLQESLSRVSILDDQPGAGSAPRPVNIADRSASIPASPTTYDYFCDTDGNTYKVLPKQFTHSDGSCGLRLKLENGERFMQCSIRFSSFSQDVRSYTEPDFDEDQHIVKLMLIKDYAENEGCLDFLIKNDIVKVVGKVESGLVDFPIVQLTADRKLTKKSIAFGSADSLSVRIAAFSSRVLVPRSKRFQQFLSEGAKAKEVLSELQSKVLSNYIREPKLKTLESSSFKHIAIFVDSGQQTPRLDVACCDFGYTLQELKQFRLENKSPVDVAVDALSR